jgi:hypothetical protein
VPHIVLVVVLVLVLENALFFERSGIAQASDLRKQRLGFS